MVFEEAVQYISSLQSRGWRLGLDRMARFLESAGLAPFLGEGEKSPRYIHIAGTNGKGSVTAFVQSILIEQGWRTGATFSPFVFDLRERVQFGRDLISKDAFTVHTSKLKTASEWLEDSELGGLTEFEFKTALGFSFWAEQNAQWVALEVGLGGRLDATNVVTPAACVITSIGLDHTNILGHTYAAIAREKAGIIKPGCPVIVGEMPHEALDVIQGLAGEKNAPIWRFGKEILLKKKEEGWLVETPKGSFESLKPKLHGVKQPQNMALAVSACEAAGALRDPSKVQAGTEMAWLPGRFQWVSHKGQEVLLDGAHNAEAAEALAESIQPYRAQFERVVLLTNMLQGHDPRTFYRYLGPLTDSVHVAPIDFPRAYSPVFLSKQIQNLFKRVQSHLSLSAAFEAALNDAGREGLVLVTGSFYLLGDLGRLISGSLQK